LFQGKLTPSLLRGAGWVPERLWTFGGRKNVLLVSNIGPSNPEPIDQVKTIIEKCLWVYGTCVSSSRGTAPEYRLINIRTWTLMPTDDDLYNRGVTDYRKQNTFCEASSFSASQAFPSFFSNSNVSFPINKLTRTRHWFLSVLDESSPHSYILFFKIHFKFFHLRRGLPGGLFLVGFPTKLLPEFVFSSMCVRSSLLSWFDHLNTKYELLFIQLHFPVNSSLLQVIPNIPHDTLFLKGSMLASRVATAKPVGFFFTLQGQNKS
jgi:hypothetical protein